MVTSAWNLVKTITYTEQSGEKHTTTESTPGVFGVDYVAWSSDSAWRIGMSRVPYKVEISAHIEYKDKNGNTVVGPESNTISYFIPIVQ